MIKIEVKRDKARNITAFKVSGHAGQAKLGEDIVCSAVSVLTQSAVQGLKLVANIAIKYEIRDGYLRCNLPNKLTERQLLMSTAILETMYVGLKNIEQGYKKYIDVRENEEV